MNLNVIIADDEHLARETIRTYLKEFENVNLLEEVSNGQEALISINKYRPDLIFLDIKMPKLDGISLLEHSSLEHLPFVIFTSAYDEFALKAFELNAIDYLLKPFDKSRFVSTLEKAFEKMKFLKWKGYENQLVQFESNKIQSEEAQTINKFPTKIVIRDSKKINHILVEEIVHINGSGDYVEIHHDSKKSLYYKTISAFLDRLDPNIFKRIHKSYIINCNKISEIRPHTNGEYYFHMIDGSILKSGRTYKNTIRNLVQGNI